jgi:hypothetical protein
MRTAHRGTPPHNEHLSTEFIKRSVRPWLWQRRLQTPARQFRYDFTDGYVSALRLRLYFPNYIINGRGTCGERLNVNLMRLADPHWYLSMKRGKASCGSHFWMTDNKVFWLTEESKSDRRDGDGRGR